MEEWVQGAILFRFDFASMTSTMAGGFVPDAGQELLIPYQIVRLSQGYSFDGRCLAMLIAF